MDSKEDKKGFAARMERLANGKGYYAVMAVCALVIAVSVWSLLRQPETKEQAAEASVVVAPVPVDVPTPSPAEPEASETGDAAGDIPAEPSAEETTVYLEDAAETAAEQTFVAPVNGTLQRPYSITALAFDATMRDWRTHDGADFAAEAGEKVYAVTDGTVTDVFYDDFYGTTVTINHGNGLVFSYSGLQEIPTVYAGDTVSSGDTIGAVGQTCKCEIAQGPHLHLAATMNGESVSPTDYLPALG